MLMHFRTFFFRQLAKAALLVVIFGAVCFVAVYAGLYSGAFVFHLVEDYFDNPVLSFLLPLPVAFFVGSIVGGGIVHVASARTIERMPRFTPEIDRTTIAPPDR